MRAYKAGGGGGDGGGYIWGKNMYGQQKEFQNNLKLIVVLITIFLKFSCFFLALNCHKKPTSLQ